METLNSFFVERFQKGSIDAVIGVSDLFIVTIYFSRYSSHIFFVTQCYD